MKKILGGLFAVLFMVASVAASTVYAGEKAEYIGVKKCKMCHYKQYKSWKKTKMVDSFENLKPGVMVDAKKKAGLDPDKDYTSDPDCLKCHTTGYGEPGGFTSIEETPKLAGVQCEECHGPGSIYRKIMMKDKKYKLEDVKAAGLILPSEDKKGCLQCHGDENPFNADLDPKYGFNFDEMLENAHEHYPKKYEH